MSRQVLSPNLTANDSTAKAELGARWEDPSNGKVYRYVKVVDLDLVNGDVVTAAATNGYTVTKDRSGGSSLGFGVVGVAVGAITATYYGWIQIAGLHTAVKTDGGVAAGDMLIPHVSADGQADTITPATTAHRVFGFATNTDTTTTTPRSIAFLRTL